MSIGQGDIIVRTFQNTPTVWVSERLICDALGETEDLYLERAQTRKYSSMLSPSASQINRSVRYGSCSACY